MKALKKARTSLFHIVLLVCLLLLISCGDNEITEVGNPTTGSTTNGTVTALTDSFSGVLDVSSSGPALIKRAGIRHQTGETEGQLSCTHDSESQVVTCSCPGGGNMVETFVDPLPMPTFGAQIEFEHTFTLTFNECLIETCDDTVTLNGSATGQMEGSYNVATGESNIEGSMNTSESCSGMTAGDSSFGFDMNMTFDGTTTDFAGSFCIDDEPLSFEDIDELHALCE